MESRYTYLLINFLTVLFPVILSFDKKVNFFKSWKYIFPGLLISGAMFLIWDYVFTVYDVWSFNPRYIIGVYFFELPLEEILFFITVPFACLFIYACLNYYIKIDYLGRISLHISYALAQLSMVMLLIYYQRVYTVITFMLLFVICVYLILKRPVFLGRFYLAFLVSLLPFYIVNGLLTSIPVVLYNDLENCGFRVGTIPFEDHFYSLSMLILNVLLFEYFKKASVK
ncbi:lycopene cyclase domain-containing protein [Desertivirga xinjiangensis]|uniref:lycopene cyclase domain-containing protein n=1 Tax=Desertivirga xinjiangensis TaxID=539206 RepID=UPI00210C0D77|nr:lycopene cyclase domain-containing protein [Pedobacter xinjiangensis]